MRRSYRAAAIAALASSSEAASASLTDVCTVANVQAALPANGTLLGINLIPSTVTASAVYNATTGGGMGSGSSTGSNATYNYCNVTVAYTHTGKGDKVVLKYAFPEPSTFKNRFYVGGGGGFSLSSDATGGLPYGATGGATDAGYDAFSNSYDEVVLYGNGSINWDATYMFGYQALGEMTKVGKPLTQAFYSLSSDTKVYTYFEGCSDGGREGMSQVQRFGEEYDGAITGAPAFRFAHQQVLHVFSSAVETILDYLPPPCELAKIVNATIAACDPLDGRTDGVVSRTDLCQLNFDLNSIVGQSYYCAAKNSTSLGFGFNKRSISTAKNKHNRRQAPGSSTSYQPAQNGTVTKEGVAVAQAIYNGPHNSAGQRAYLSWQIASELGDASTTYNTDSGVWELSIPSTGGEYVTKFIQLLDLDNLSASDLDGITYDTLVDWINTGYVRYYDSLQTTVPDLTPFQSSGGKLLHYHGESDSSIPAASSVHYWQSVRSVMYGNLTDDAAREALSEWYQFYLVPGAGHCGTNSLQPGPYPQNNIEVMIDWVENGITPQRLNATVSSSTGVNAGETQLLCQWPTRPLWKGNSSDFECVEDQKSVESWTYEFPAFKVPVY
ncbi:tannase and feruloyl esterase [Hypoxylon trugodes]|uniref:tannase and feruloyl esterase n=1 Tax=Hypoxylon trugodes TaxID=326681 RepID=UPI002195E833|nr:tannase and feruloyl esterase [Hypoxylon trugodes]KAI1389637.1 tannase and feruloyl esterase [Hypoxylon trugodes]